MRKSIPVAALVLAGLAALTGCGPSTAAPADNGGDSTSGEPVAITLGVIPALDVAPVYLGVREGFFEDENLDVTLELAQGGAAIVPAVVSGDYQFGFSNVTSLLLATSNGVPLKAVAPGDSTTGVDPDFSGVVVRADSPVQSAEDLPGHTVAVNSLNNIGDSTIRKVVETAGGDPSAVSFVEIGFPDMPAALASGQVDAAWIVEPHLTRAIQADARVVAWNYQETDPELMNAAYFTSQQFAAKNPDTVAAFVRALTASFEYAQDNPEETRAILDEYTDIDPAVKEAMTLPRFGTEFSVESVELLADLALEYGLVTSEIDYTDLLP